MTDTDLIREMAEALDELLGPYTGGAASALDDEYVVERSQQALTAARERLAREDSDGAIYAAASERASPEWHAGYKAGLATGAALAAQPAAVSVQAVERAWLVEWRFNGIQWLYLWPRAPGGFNFTADAAQALRFARREDAEAALQWARDTDARRGAGRATGEMLVTEHEWIAAQPAAGPADEQVPVLMRAVRLAWTGDHAGAARYVELAAERSEAESPTTARALRSMLDALQNGTPEATVHPAAQPAPEPAEPRVPEVTGEMWSAGRSAFLLWAQRWEDAKTSEQASAIADVAGADILRAMIAAAPSARPVAPAGWLPVETAPKDNKRRLYLARFDDKGELRQLSFDGGWEYWQESHEMPHINGWGWVSNDGIEEPTHWAYQDGPPPSSVCTFAAAWESKVAEGYQYGPMALENVRMGWAMAVAELAKGREPTI